MRYFTCLLLSVFCCYNIGFAKAHDIICPHVSSVKNAAAKLDTVGDFYDLTYVWTSTPAFSENDRLWSVATVVKKDKYPTDELISIGRGQVSKVTELETPTAEETSVYVCYYGPTDVIAISSRFEHLPLFSVKKHFR